MTRDYSALMNAAFELEGFSGYLTSEDEKAQGKVQQAFNSARNVFVYDTLKTGVTADEAKQQVLSELEEMERLQPEWGNTYAYVRQELFDRIDGESSKSPLLRKIVRWTPMALGIVALIVYLGIRFTSGVDVTAPIESKLGLQQRAAAAEKVITYDEWANTRIRRGGFLKGILLWPIEPSEPEVKAANEFVGLTFEGYDLLSQQSQLCGVVARGYGEQLSQDELDFADGVAERMQEENLKWVDPPAMTILEVIKAKFPCAK